jgi:hypothetical protein
MRRHLTPVRCTEAGENLSDRESVVSGVVTRNLRRKENKKAQAKVQTIFSSINFNIQLYRTVPYGTRSTPFFM